MNLPALAMAFGVTWTPVPVPVAKVVQVVDNPVAASGTEWTYDASAVFDASGAARTWDEALDDLATARVVAVGEQHDDAAHRKIQAEVLSGLAKRTPRLAVAFEMVGYEDQAVLDSFMSGALPETDFAVWWKTNWGFDFAIYKPIFDAAKAAGVPAYGLNAPRDVVKSVSKRGLASLTPVERARIPATIAESSDERYRQYVLDSVSGHGAPRPRPSRAWSRPWRCGTRRWARRSPISQPKAARSWSSPAKVMSSLRPASPKAPHAAAPRRSRCSSRSQTSPRPTISCSRTGFASHLNG